MYPYNTDVVNVSHSEYPQYVKELYSLLRLDFCCKFTHIYFNSKILWQNNWNLLRNKQEPLIGNYIAKADNKKTLTPSGFREAGPTVLNIIGDMSVPLRGTMGMECCVQRTHSGAASQLAGGFRKYGPASRNPQLMIRFGEWYKVTYYGEIILCSWVCRINCIRGCVATARRHSLLGLSCILKTCSSCLHVKKIMSSCLKDHVLHVRAQKKVSKVV